jgi:Zn finger protein HypA/HybF involved in hydrogenase expression
MHELSIVMRILDTVEETAKKHQASVVHEIEMAVGVLSGVEFDALILPLKFSQLLCFRMLNLWCTKYSPCKMPGLRNEFSTDQYSTPCTNVVL